MVCKAERFANPGEREREREREEKPERERDRKRERERERRREGFLAPPTPSLLAAPPTPHTFSLVRSIQQCMQNNICVMLWSVTKTGSRLIFKGWVRLRRLCRPP